MQCQTILVGEDTDLIVLLCFHVTNSCYDIFFKSEKGEGQNETQDAGISKNLGRDICTNLLFAHAILGCDITSQVFSLGKGSALKYIRFDSYFTKQARIFLDENATENDIINAGEAALVSPYKGTVCETLDDLRLLRFHQLPVPLLCNLNIYLRLHQQPSTTVFVFFIKFKCGKEL